MVRTVRAGTVSYSIPNTYHRGWHRVGTEDCLLNPFIHFINIYDIPTVMVNFMCQLEWATRCPDIWSNIILGMSARVFIGEIDV